MNRRGEFLGIVVAVSAVVALAGIGYIWVFWTDVNPYAVNPLGGDSGLQNIQLSPLDCENPSVEKSLCPYNNEILCEIVWDKCIK